MTESGVSSIIRLEASQLGYRLWRNNVGALQTPAGQFIRFGLANDSPQLNKAIKSADLIGIKPILITHAHVGLTIGQFISREIKHEGWKYTGADREKAQVAWAE